MTTVYVHTPDVSHAAGGIRFAYRLVDICNAAGVPAAVMHQRRGFRAGWFENRTAVVAAVDTLVYGNDVLVVSELDAPALVPTTAPGVTKVILNQHHFWTFVQASFDYRHPDVAAVLTVSEDAVRYLAHAFPGLQPLRIRYAVDPAIFHLDGRSREPTIAFLANKGAGPRVQVMRILEQRDALQGWRTLPLVGLAQNALAELLRHVAIVAAFSEAEGFQMFLTEAMASGCAVVGFDGGGGREYLTEEVAWPVPLGDIIRFAERVEEVTRAFSSASPEFEAKTRRAVCLVQHEYTLEHEAADVVDALRPVVELAARKDPGRGYNVARVRGPAAIARERARAVARAALWR
jgi:hypothetical protein